MSDSIRNLLMLVAQFMALVGVCIIFLIRWEVWRAEGDNAYIQRDQLQTVSGFVKEASEITEARKRGRTKKKYYQLEVVPEDGGETLKLRIRYGIPRSWVEHLLGENVTLLYKRYQEVEVYEAAIVGQKPELTYEDTRDYLIADAQATAEKVNSAGYWFLAISMLGLGIGGFVWQYKLKKNAAARKGDE